MPYPKEFCRGALSYDPQFFETLTLDKGTCKYIPQVSIFKPFTEPSTPRQDDCLELSINWMDNDEAMNTLFLEKKDGEVRYKAGVCKVKLKMFKFLMKRYEPLKYLSYERQPLDNNEYHGNLLMKKENKKMLYDETAHFLATYAIHIPNPNLYPKNEQAITQ